VLKLNSAQGLVFPGSLVQTLAPSCLPQCIMHKPSCAIFRVTLSPLPMVVILPCYCSALKMLSFSSAHVVPFQAPPTFLSPESLQPNLTFGSQTWVTPSQLFSSLESMQSVSPSQRHRRGMHSPSKRHWNSSVWQPPGGLVAAGDGEGTLDQPPHPLCYVQCGR
jgi:hypothetical protein